MNADTARTIVLDALGEVAPDLDQATLRPDAEFGDELDLDSMDFLSLIELVSNAVGRDIPEHDYPQVRTLASFTDYLVANVAAEVPGR